MNKTTCPFCDKAQSYRYIAETESVLAIYPKAPACKYHVLITPKRHTPYLDGLTSREAAEAHVLIASLVRAARENIPDFIGYNILSNNGGSKVSQKVMHCHVHLFLRVASDTSNPITTRHNTSPPDLTKEDLENLNNLRQWASKKPINTLTPS